MRIVRLGLLDNGSSIFDTTLKQKCVGRLHSNTNSVAAAVGSPYSVTTIRLLKKRYRRRCAQSVQKVQAAQVVEKQVLASEIF